MRRLIVVALVFGAVVLAGGCASAPSRFYTLSPVPSAAPGKGGVSLSVVVGPVSVPEVVDRPQMVLRVGANQVRLDEFNRWASSLQDAIARTVAQDLAMRLDTPNVSLASQGPKSDAACRVSIAVQRFESVLGEAATLDALWAVRGAKEEAARIGRTVVTEPAQGATHDAVVAAHSRAIGRLSQDIAEAIELFKLK